MAIDLKFYILTLYHSTSRFKILNRARHSSISMSIVQSLIITDHELSMSSVLSRTFSEVHVVHDHVLDQLPSNITLRRVIAADNKKLSSTIYERSR